jgi:hypothetical protein
MWDIHAIESEVNRLIWSQYPQHVTHYWFNEFTTEGPIRRTREGAWMGADKNSSRRRWKLQQDEHVFQHTSPTHYPSWPSPRSHWSATRPRNQHTTFRPENAAERQTSSPLTNNGQTGEHHRSDRPCWWNLATSTKWLHTGQADATHRSDRSQPESPKSPNRTTDLQTDPNSKQPQHRTTANSPRRSPEQKPTKGCTG